MAFKEVVDMALNLHRLIWLSTMLVSIYIKTMSLDILMCRRKGF